MNRKENKPADPLIDRWAAEVIEEKHLTQRLRRNTSLRIKYGIDPTGHHLHLGHVVPLRLLRAWQEAGHRAVIIIGDYTAQVGDPSGRDKQRASLSAEMVKSFSASYLEQLARVIDVRRAEIRYNSEWYEKFTAADFLKLTGTMTVQRLLSHDTFRRRLDSNLPLSLQETIYPLLQGYDSVAVEADVELGGLDQKFNLLTGRDVQQAYGQEPQDVQLTPYLTGLDGKEKMSKSASNFIAIDDVPGEMYGKLMSIPDKLIPEYLRLTTDLPAAEIAALTKSLRGKKTNPKDIKEQLARTVVTLYYNRTAAAEAAEEFHRVHRRKQAPTTMPVADVRAGTHQLLHLLVNHRLAGSRSEARRLIEQGGVKVDGQVIDNWEAEITVSGQVVLQVGKRHFLTLRSGRS